nr:PREDICTED: tumor necrosis factor receptor superfamily member 27 [Anolis carolinensis]|eukprot:XP_008123396.1 PREDICTED: tumor necrosis factor receptor superfamily member 27 [Anolis carolinensis]
MAKEAVLMLFLMFASQVPRFPANPLECRENEYLDGISGKCSPCKPCGPGMELSQECGFGEGAHARCVPCPPRRFKEVWGLQRCKPCASCGLINRLQRSNCTASSDATCAQCFPGFYSKTQIGGVRGLECVPCTKQTPPSELQCRTVVSPEQEGGPLLPAQDAALLALTVGALAIALLVTLAASILCGRRFWKRQCQRVLFRSRSLPVPRVTFQAPAFPTDDPASEASCSCDGNTRPSEGPWGAGPCLPEAEGVPGLGDPGGLGFPSCVAEGQPHRWTRVPVECTETDLQRFSVLGEMEASPTSSFRDPVPESGEPVISPLPLCKNVRR